MFLHFMIINQFRLLQPNLFLRRKKQLLLQLSTSIIHNILLDYLNIHLDLLGTMFLMLLHLIEIRSAIQMYLNFNHETIYNFFFLTFAVTHYNITITSITVQCTYIVMKKVFSSGRSLKKCFLFKYKFQYDIITTHIERVKQCCHCLFT